MYRSDDPLRDFDRWDFDEERWLASRPKCAECGEPITTDTAYRFEGELICEDCMHEHKVWIEE